VLKLTAEVLEIQIEAAQGGDGSDLAAEQTKLANILNLISQLRDRLLLLCRFLGQRSLYVKRGTWVKREEVVPGEQNGVERKYAYINYHE